MRRRDHPVSQFSRLPIQAGLCRRNEVIHLSGSNVVKPELLAVIVPRFRIGEESLEVAAQQGFAIAIVGSMA